jgi:hypothetical protein
MALQPRVGPWPPLRVLWQIYYDVGYQAHDQPVLVILIQPQETFCGEATIDIW